MELKARDVGSLEWMTLAECARDVKVALEVVRGWCVAFEAGDRAGLPSAHYGAKSADDAKRLNRRVHVEDWRKFKAARRLQQQEQAREERREARRVDRMVAKMPYQYAGRRASKLKAGAVAGPDQLRP